MPIGNMSKILDDLSCKNIEKPITNDTDEFENNVKKGMEIPNFEKHTREKQISNFKQKNNSDISTEMTKRGFGTIDSNLEIVVGNVAIIPGYHEKDKAKFKKEGDKHDVILEKKDESEEIVIVNNIGENAVKNEIEKKDIKDVIKQDDLKNNATVIDKAANSDKKEDPEIKDKKPIENKTENLAKEPEPVMPQTMPEHLIMSQLSENLKDKNDKPSNLNHDNNKK